MPYVRVWVDDPEASMEDFDDDELAEELRKRGYVVRKNAVEQDPAPQIQLHDKDGKYVPAVASIDLSKVRHKLSLHMTRDAADEALFLVERALDMPYAFSMN